MDAALPVITDYPPLKAEMAAETKCSERYIVDLMAVGGGTILQSVECLGECSKGQLSRSASADG